MTQLASLRAIDDEISKLASQVEEPQPRYLTVRHRIGSLVKRSLYRFLWWQSYQIHTLMALLAKRGREEANLINALSDGIDLLRQRAGPLPGQLEDAHRMILDCQRRLQENESRLQRMESEQQSLQTHVTARLSEFSRRLEITKPHEEALLGRPDHRDDALYAAFEDTFRGSREEVKFRQSVYLPLLREFGIGTQNMPILDLGCGRGEWLELLSENNLKARGIDQNETMIDRCRDAGFDAAQADALAYLNALPDACIGAVTSFHMVEHMPFSLVLRMIDEALRVLKSGGLLILETPNPQNILVGAYTFYMDPSHRKPLPSPMLRFYVEARGFSGVEVKELHPYPDSARLLDRGDGLANRLNDYFYGPQDYAVIGRKPPEDDRT